MPIIVQGMMFTGRELSLVVVLDMDMMGITLQIRSSRGP